MSADLVYFGHDYRLIGQSIYNVPALTYLLETETFSIVENQLKCCSVADDAAPDCRMIWSGAVCCRQGHQRVAQTAARLMDNTSNICSEPQTSLFCLILLFYNFAKTSCLERSQIVACCNM